jgi:hypothetical protein
MLRRFLLVLTVIALFAGIAAYMGISLARATILDTDFFIEAADSTDLVDYIHNQAAMDLPGMIEEELGSHPMTAGMFTPDARSILSAAAADAALRAADRQWISEQIRRLSSVFIPWVVGDSEYVDYQIAVRPLVERSRDYLIENLQNLSDQELSQLYLRRSGIEMTVSMLLGAVEFPEAVSLSQIIRESGYQDEVEQSVEEIRRAIVFHTYLPVIVLVLVILTMLLSGIFPGMIWSGAVGLLISVLFLIATFLSRSMAAIQTAALETSLPISLVDQLVVLATDGLLDGLLLIFAGSLIVMTIGIIGTMRRFQRSSR